ncbi:MAG: hypothetical protein H4O13_05870 [Xanthomonadales bacterium]|nr:hypothetical protein [Xanthomonadales bacterium]
MNPHWASPVLIALSFIAFGVLEGLTWGDRAAEFVLPFAHGVLLAFLLFWWASADATQHGARLSTGTIVCIVVFGLLWVPFYLANTRPARAWFRWLSKGLLLLALCFGSYLGVLSLFDGVGAYS